jgi:hypothetical protein
MRLLEFDSNDQLRSKDFTENIPPYAILSHTWGADDAEVTFDDLKNRSGTNKASYAKIQFCGEQARKDSLQYFWVDTCCINKTDSVELQEAINSMFRWYRDAGKCYVYLAAVSVRNGDDDHTKRTWEQDFRKSRWFKRGWTLQELIAPTSVEFFSREGEYLGSRTTLEQQIHEVTGIPILLVVRLCLSSALRSECDGQLNATQRRGRTRHTVYWGSSMSFCLLYMVRGRTRSFGFERRSTNAWGESLTSKRFHMPKEPCLIPMQEITGLVIRPHESTYYVRFKIGPSNPRVRASSGSTEWRARASRLSLGPSRSG